jgi:RNase P/RNase MRP subunit POP5
VSHHLALVADLLKNEVDGILANNRVYGSDTRMALNLIHRALIINIKIKSNGFDVLINVLLFSGQYSVFSYRCYGLPLKCAEV